MSKETNISRRELRAALSLALVFAVRLLGLFMIYPVFASYAGHLQGATPFTIGLALGIYGLSQGLLQIPFGLLSDRIGRKIMIALGLIMFALGSAVAALSTSITGVMIGRAIQGAGAIGSVILALVADLTREEHRTTAMAVVGITIGLSFLAALILGPVLSGIIGVPGIFWLMAVLAFVAIAITQFVVPAPQLVVSHRDAETVSSMLGSVLRNRELLRLDFGIFALHVVLTSSFLVVPAFLSATLSIPGESQWTLYLPVLAVSFGLMIPAIIVAEKYRRMKSVFVTSVAVLAGSQGVLLIGAQNATLLILAITAFFSAFNIVEASLPSLVTKTAPPDAKGTATGVYSSSQFLGIFVGGAAGGWVHQIYGTEGVFILTSGVALIWLIVAATMPKPGYYTTRLLRISPSQVRNAASFVERLRQMPGVADAVIVAPERMVYLKIDSDVFEPAEVQKLVDTE